MEGYRYNGQSVFKKFNPHPFLFYTQISIYSWLDVLMDGRIDGWISSVAMYGTGLLCWDRKTACFQRYFYPTPIFAKNIQNFLE